jgi:hypothetical protein
MLNIRKTANPKLILIDNKVDGLAWNQGNGMPYNIFAIYLESGQK